MSEEIRAGRAVGANTGTETSGGSGGSGQIKALLQGLLPRTLLGFALWFVVVAILITAILPAGGCEWNPKSAAYDGVPRTREEVAALQAAERERVIREQDLKAAEAKAKALEAEAAARTESERLTREAEARTRAAQREYATALKRVASQSESAKIELQARLDEVDASARDDLAEGLARVKIDGDAAASELTRSIRALNAMRDQALADSDSRAKLAAAEIARKEEQQVLLASLINSAPVKAVAGAVPGGQSWLEMAALVLGGGAATRVLTRKLENQAWDESEKRTEAKAKEIKDAEDRGWTEASANNNLGSVLAALIPLIVKAQQPSAGTVATPPIVAANTTAATPSGT